MKQTNGEKSLKERIREGEIRRRDVTRRLAELAFGKANDCVRLALEDDPRLDKLDLSLLSEVKRNDKGTVEIKLIDRLRLWSSWPLWRRRRRRIWSPSCRRCRRTGHELRRFLTQTKTGAQLVGAGE